MTTAVEGATDGKPPSGVARWVPAVTWLRKYRKSYWAGDLLAGLVVAALAVPQALGYSGIAGVPVLVGLYAIPLALVAYALLGSSPNLVVGPVSTVSVLSGTLVADMANGDVSRTVPLTAALAIGAGLGLVAGGLGRLGWAAEFMSRPIVTGFVFGLVILIILGEVPGLLGLPPAKGDVFGKVLGIGEAIIAGDVVPLTAAIGAISLAILFLGAKFVPRVPWGLLVLIGGIALSGALGLSGRGVAVVGEVPTGLPPLGLPGITLNEIPPVLAGGLALALVGLAEGLSAARIFAAKGGYSVDSDQELIATGAANMAAGLSGGMGVAGSLSKTAAAERSGGRTQMAGIAAAVIVLIVLVALAGALQPLPRAVLSAIVVQAVWGLMDVSAIKRYRSIRRNDFNSCIAAMVGVLLLGPLYGLLVAMGLAVLGLVYRSSRVDMDVMGRVPEEKAAWGSVSGHPERMTYPGVLVVRLDSPLFWANASEVAGRLLREVAGHPETRAVLLDLEATSQLDTTSIDALDLVRERLDEEGIALYLVRVFYRTRRVLARSGFTTRLGEERMWHSISAGVRAARDDLGLTGKSRPVGEAVAEAEPRGDAGEEVVVIGDEDDLEVLPVGAERIAVETEAPPTDEQLAAEREEAERAARAEAERAAKSTKPNGKKGKKAKGNGKGNGKGSGSGKGSRNGKDKGNGKKAKNGAGAAAAAGAVAGADAGRGEVAEPPAGAVPQPVGGEASAANGPMMAADSSTSQPEAAAGAASVSPIEEQGAEAPAVEPGAMTAAEPTAQSAAESAQKGPAAGPAADEETKRGGYHDLDEMDAAPPWWKVWRED